MRRSGFGRVFGPALFYLATSTGPIQGSAGGGLLKHLDQIEFCRLRLRLDFLGPCRLPEETLPRLRRDLHRAGRSVLDEVAFSGLFDPSLAADPVAQRRFQRPGPPFILAPAPELPGTFGAGDGLPLTVTLWGDGVRRLDDFLAVMAAVGQLGLGQGEGRFAIGTVAAEDPAGALQSWRGKDHTGLPITSAAWWLARQPVADLWKLEMLSPARLISKGRPLFRPRFPQLFRFILRRLTSLSFAHCGLEIVTDAGELLAAADGVEVRVNHLAWKDWRSLDAESGPVDLGGVTGDLCFANPWDEDLLAVLQLGSLLNLGKGASFASGAYRLLPA